MANGDGSSVDERLVEAAMTVRQSAHAPYSDFRVGSAVLDESGRVHVGCNVENASYPEGVCAETSAIAAMVAAGGKRITAIAVAGGPSEIVPCTPCGGCRQRIAEFADDDTRVLLVGPGGTATNHTIAELLPDSFSLPRNG